MKQLQAVTRANRRVSKCLAPAAKRLSQAADEQIAACQDLTRTLREERIEREETYEPSVIPEDPLV